MPKLTKERRKENIKMLTKDVINHRGNLSAVAREYGVSRQCIQKKMANPRNKCIVRELLNDEKFKSVLISMGIEGLQATKLVPAAGASFVEVPDHSIRFKYWNKFLEAMGFAPGGINIKIGNDIHMKNTKIMQIVRAPGRGEHETIDAEEKLKEST